MPTKLIIFVGVLGASLSAPFVRIANAPSMVLVLYRVAIAAALLLPYALLRHREELRGTRGRDLLLCALSGLFLGLHFTFYFQSLRYTSIASSLSLVDTEVFFVAFLSVLLFKEKIPRLAWLGIFTAFAGSVIISMSDAGSGANVLLGDGLAVIGAVCVAVYTIIGRVCRRSMSTTVYTLFVYLFASATVLIILLFSGTPLGGYEPVNLLAALGLAVFCTLLGHSIFSWGLKYESAAFISTVKLLEPVFASVIGVFLFREIPKLPVVFGALIVISGVYLFTRFSGSGTERGSPER